MKKGIMYILLSISTLISTFMFVGFYPPKWLSQIVFIPNIHASEQWLVFLFWFITLFLTVCVLLLSRNNPSKKVFLTFTLLIFAEILLLPIAANHKFIADIYIIYTTFVNMSVCIFTLVQLKSVN